MISRTDCRCWQKNDDNENKVKGANEKVVKKKRNMQHRMTLKSEAVSERLSSMDRMTMKMIRHGGHFEKD